MVALDAHMQRRKAVLRLGRDWSTAFQQQIHHLVVTTARRTVKRGQSVLQRIDTRCKRQSWIRQILGVKPKFHLARHVSTRHDTFDVPSPCILAVSSLYSTARHARLDELDTLNGSYRDVTSQVEFGLNRAFYTVCTIRTLLLIFSNTFDSSNNKRCHFKANGTSTAEEWKTYSLHARETISKCLL